MSKSAPQKTPSSLYLWNMWLAVLHALQGAAILLLSTTHTFPVETSYLTTSNISSQLAGQPVLASASRHLFDVNLAYLVAAFFFMSALADVFVATKYRKR